MFKKKLAVSILAKALLFLSWLLICVADLSYLHCFSTMKRFTKCLGLSRRDQSSFPHR